MSQANRQELKMKIDDIFRKCIEIPGVSIKRSEFNAELLMKTKEAVSYTHLTLPTT
mgnify:CR=1 FL=1